MRNQELLDEQSVEASFFFVARNEANRVIGRVNLVDVVDGSASLGYRIAQEATGVGHAGRAVRLAIRFAYGRGLQTITAMTATVHPSCSGVRHEVVQYLLNLANDDAVSHR